VIEARSAELDQKDKMVKLQSIREFCNDFVPSLLPIITVTVIFWQGGSIDTATLVTAQAFFEMIGDWLRRSSHFTRMIDEIKLSLPNVQKLLDLHEVQHNVILEQKND